LTVPARDPHQAVILVGTEGVDGVESVEHLGGVGDPPIECRCCSRQLLLGAAQRFHFSPGESYGRSGLRERPTS
jgi:hypothetical protein